MRELKQLAPVTGAFSNITDEAITEAENDPPPTPEALGLEIPDPGPEKNPGRKEQTKTARAERDYARQLRQVARHVGEIINGFEPGDIDAFPSLNELLRRYADALKPWAEATAGRMLGEVELRDRESWRELGNAISVALRRELMSAPVGATLRELLNDQVDLIRSIPTEAAQRVHELTLKGLEDSTRAREIAIDIRASGAVAESRALLIARTEVSRTASSLVQARCVHVGAEEYVWRTSSDGAVRPGHRAMEGKACKWASPPAVNEGGRIMLFHAGQIWNCRCWPEPILRDD